MNYLNKIKNFAVSLKDKAYDKVSKLNKIKIKYHEKVKSRK